MLFAGGFYVRFDLNRWVSVSQQMGIRSTSFDRSHVGEGTAQPMLSKLAARTLNGAVLSPESPGTLNDAAAVIPSRHSISFGLHFARAKARLLLDRTHLTASS
jgi:hypothetical protein